MIEPNTYRISAFTIFEVTVVLAVMSVLISIIAASLNRFNEQLKMTSDIRIELNQWYAVRSVIWKDFYAADSVEMVASEMHIHTANGLRTYRISEGILERNAGDAWISMHMETEELYIDTLSSAEVCHMGFVWKEKPMDLRFAFQPGVDVQINRYFEQLK